MASMAGQALSGLVRVRGQRQVAQIGRRNGLREIRHEVRPQKSRAWDGSGFPAQSTQLYRFIGRATRRPDFRRPAGCLPGFSGDGGGWCQPQRAR